MPVETLEGAASFIVFLAPGALWAWLAERRQAVVPRSPVMELGLIGLTSAAFSMPVLVITGLLAWLIDRDLSSLEAWLGPSGPSGEVVVAYTALLLLQLALALLLAWAVFRTCGHTLLGPLDVRRISGWASVFRYDRPDDTWSVAVEVLLNDRSVLRGMVQDYTPDHELIDRELVLAHPITHELDGVSLFGPRPAPHRVVLPASAIQRIAVHYVRPEDLEAFRSSVPAAG